MEAITKDDGRLGYFCEAIRERIGLGDYDIEYYIANEWDEEIAAEIDLDASPVCVKFKDLFFNQEWEKQMEIIIHEHVHVITNSLTRVAHTAVHELPHKERKLELFVEFLEERESIPSYFQKVLFWLMEDELREYAEALQ